MSVLIIAEHEQGLLKNDTAKVVSAAQKLNKEITVLVAGSNVTTTAEEASKIAAVTKVLVADNAVYEHQLAENLADLVVDLAPEYTHIFAAATTTGKNFMPRVAALLDKVQISDIIDVLDDATFKRPIYAGNAIATVKSNEDKLLVTVRSSAFDAAPVQDAVDVTPIDVVKENALSQYVSQQATESERPELTAADVIISGGRGMQNGENFALLNGVADKLGAAIGASRAAVDAGFVPNDMQVGQTGKIVAPNLYIAVGISGAIQHLAGMKDSKVIVAINKDPDAPIFQVADYGLVADLFEVLPELESSL